MANRSLALYRRMLRAGRTWPKIEERPEIAKEVKSVFRANAGASEEQTEKLVFDGQARLELALHYKIYAPRHVYSQKGTMEGDTNDRYRRGPSLSLQDD